MGGLTLGEARSRLELIAVPCRIVTATDEALGQLATLLAEYAKLRGQQTHVSRYPSNLALIQRLLAAIQRLTAPTSTYAHAASLQANSNVHSATRLSELVATASALRDDIAAGWLTSVVELAHADTYAGYLEMAEGLLGQGYKDAAAVITGTSLQVHLRALAREARPRPPSAERWPEEDGRHERRAKGSRGG